MKKIISLENLILLTIFLLPTYLIKLNFFGISLNILEVLILLVLFLWIFRKDKKTFSAIKENKMVFISTGIIFLSLAISTFLNPNYKTEWGIIKGWFFLPFLFAFAAQDVFAGEKKKKIFKAYFYSTLAVAIIALIYFLSGKITFDGRLEAFFNSPNYLVMYLAPGFISGIFLNDCVIPGLTRNPGLINLLDSRESGNDKNRNSGTFKATHINLGLKSFIYYFSLGLILLAIYLTKSYAGWLSLFLAVLITTFLIYRKKAIGYLLAGILFFLIIIFFQFQTTKLGDLINVSERSSLSSRIMIWQSAEKILTDNWLWGIGPGNFQDKYLEYQKYFPLYLEWAVPHPHNLYLTFWLSGGLLGILGFLGLIFFWTKSFWKKENKKKYFWILGVLLYILIHGFFDTAYFKNDLSVVFWLVILAGVSLKENKQNL